MPELEDLMCEKQYNRVVRLHTLLDEHQWSRQIPQRDIKILYCAIDGLKTIANSLYHLREEIRDG